MLFAAGQFQMQPQQPDQESKTWEMVQLAQKRPVSGEAKSHGGSGDNSTHQAARTNAA
jgi:hypothetical protein